MAGRGRALPVERGRGRVGVAEREVPRSGRLYGDEFSAGEVHNKRHRPTYSLDEIMGLGLESGRPTPHVAVPKVLRRGALGRERGVSGPVAQVSN